MNDDLVMFAVGGALAVFGIVLIASHLRARRREKAEAADDELEARHLRKRFRRRVQTSGLITALGLLIALHPVVIPEPKFAPRLFAAWWLAALFLGMWIILMALVDLLSTRAHTQVLRSRMNVQQRQLRQQLDELRARRNGHLESSE